MNKAALFSRYSDQTVAMSKAVHQLATLHNKRRVNCHMSRQKITQCCGQKAYNKDSQLIIILHIGAQCIGPIAVCMSGKTAIFSAIFTAHCRISPALLLFPVGRIAESVQRLATGWTVRGSNPGESEIFRARPDRPWGPLSLLYNGYRVFSGGKEWPGRDADPSPSSGALFIERVELYLYSPYGPQPGL